jgi:hypothetical protein
MRFATLEPISPRIKQAEAVYGKFDLGPDAMPNEWWLNRNTIWLQLREPMQSVWFADEWVRKVRMNRRMTVPFAKAEREIYERWTRPERHAHGLDQYVKCYCFLDGPGPNLHWWGAAWEVSPRVVGEVLTEVVAIFTRHGFKHDRTRLRTFEFW